MYTVPRFITAMDKASKSPNRSWREYQASCALWSAAWDAMGPDDAQRLAFEDEHRQLLEARSLQRMFVGAGADPCGDGDDDKDDVNPKSCWSLGSDTLPLAMQTFKTYQESHPQTGVRNMCSHARQSSRMGSIMLPATDSDQARPQRPPFNVKELQRSFILLYNRIMPCYNYMHISYMRQYDNTMSY